MKSRRVEEILRDKGIEKGTAYILSFLVERINAQEKSINELAAMLGQTIDTINNVVNGTVMMKEEMEAALKKHGAVGSEEPDEEEGHLQ